MRPDVRDEWKGISLRGNPRLLVGWREPRRRLDALRVRLHEDVFAELAALCRPAVDKLQNYRERPFENFAELDDDEYFWYEHAVLPARQSREGARTVESADHGLSVEDDTADLVRLVKSVDGLPDADRDDLDDPYSFYAICWPRRGSMIGFVSRMNPVATLRPGFRYFQYGDAMRTVSRPEFVLKEGADLVIGIEGTAILSPYSFETLLGDVGVVFDHVQKDVATVRKALAGTVSLSAGAERALLDEASRTRSNAKRLRLLPARLATIRLDAASVRKSLARHGVDAGLILDAGGHFLFDRQNVGLFLDVVEGRYFEDDLGGERRRADRFSTR